MTKPFRAFHALHQAYTSVFRTVDKELKSRENILTAHQLILFILSLDDGLPSSEVASRAGVSKSRLTGLVDTLESKSLLRREQGSQDARQQILFIEPEGRAIIKRTQKWVHDLNNALLTDFTKAEKAVIQKFLNNAATFPTLQGSNPPTRNGD